MERLRKLGGRCSAVFTAALVAVVALSANVASAQAPALHTDGIPDVGSYAASIGADLGATYGQIIPVVVVLMLIGVSIALLARHTRKSAK